MHLLFQEMSYSFPFQNFALSLNTTKCLFSWILILFLLFSCSVMSNSLRPPWISACQTSLSFTIFWSLLILMSTESVMSPNHLSFCHPLLLLPSVFLSIRVFSNELALPIRWPKYWSFSFSISPFNEIFRVDFL